MSREGPGREVGGEGTAARLTREEGAAVHPSLETTCYLACTKNPLDRALPPPATTSMNDIPALTSGTVASIVLSLTNL